MNKRIMSKYFTFKHRIVDILKQEKGEVNIIAIILIVIVVIGLVAIFRTQLTKIITDIFDRITQDVDSF